MALQALDKVVEAPSGWDSPANYVGQRHFPQWDCLLTRNRDSECLMECNFAVALERLGGESDHVVIHRFGHWACGWWEALAVLQGTPEHRIAEKIAEDLENYPVLDESAFSEAEQVEAEAIWCNCYNVQERLAYIRAHRSQFEFHSWADVRGCIRGNYFAGYAGELIG